MSPSKPLPLHGHRNRHRTFRGHVHERRIQHQTEVVRSWLDIEPIGVVWAAAQRKIFDGHGDLIHTRGRLQPEYWIACRAALVDVEEILGQRLVARSSQDVAVLVAYRDNGHELRRSQLASLDAKCHGPAGRHANRVAIHLARFEKARIDCHWCVDQRVNRCVDLWIVSHGERHRKRGTAGHVHKYLAHVRAGIPQVNVDFFETERSLDQLLLAVRPKETRPADRSTSQSSNDKNWLSAWKSGHPARRRHNRRRAER